MSVYRLPVLLVAENDASAGRWWGDEVGEVNAHNWRRDALRLGRWFGTVVSATRRMDDDGPWIALVIR